MTLRGSMLAVTDPTENVRGLNVLDRNREGSQQGAVVIPSAPEVPVQATAPWLSP